MRVLLLKPNISNRVTHQVNVKDAIEIIIYLNSARGVGKRGH